MQNILLDKVIITHSGEICKDKINLVAGAITLPFAEMVWLTTGGDMETINRFLFSFVNVCTIHTNSQNNSYSTIFLI